MRAGEAGPLRQWAIDHQIKVGRYLGAKISFRSTRPTSWPIPSRSALPALNGWNGWPTLPAEQRRVRIPTITDPRGTDFAPPRG